MSVNLFANNLAGIDNLSKVTFAQAIKFSKLNRVNASIQQIVTNSLNVGHDFDVITANLDSINYSVMNYTNNTPWYKKIFHFITYLKVRSLRKSLPKLINVVNQHAMTHFNISPKNIQDNDDALNAMLEGISPYLLSYQKIRFYAHNSQYLNPTGDNQPPAGDNQPPVTRTPSSILKKTDSTVAPKRPEGLKIEAQRKWEILEKAHQSFLKNNPNKGSWDQTARTINDYIFGKFQSIIDTGDATIPRFFHCTQPATWDLIVRSKSILVKPAQLGFGAFVSNQDESSPRYGTHTFALTEDSVFQFEAHYYDGHDCKGTVNSLWARVSQPIPVGPDTVAHFVVETADDGESAAIKLLTDLNLDVPIITRAASNALNLLFREATDGYTLPKKWKVHESYIHNMDTYRRAYPYKIRTS